MPSALETIEFSRLTSHGLSFARLRIAEVVAVPSCHPSRSPSSQGLLPACLAGVDRAGFAPARCLLRVSVRYRTSLSHGPAFPGRTRRPLLCEGAPRGCATGSQLSASTIGASGSDPALRASGLCEQ